MKRRYTLALCALSATLMFGGAAEAKKPFRDDDRRQSEHYQGEKAKDYDHRHSPHVIVLTEDRRAKVHAYLRSRHARHCPPGLAKKNLECLPPGQVRKYAIGEVLPPYHAPVPLKLKRMLGEPPAGTYYTMVDNDVLLVAEAGKKILDAITLLSAVQ